MVSPEQFQFMRESTGLGRREFAQLLGYGGNPEYHYDTIRKMETGDRPISPIAGRLAALVYQWWLETGETPRFDDIIRDL